MSPNEKNSNSVGTQQNQPEDSFDLNKTMQDLPNSDIANDPKKLKERITDLLKGDTEFSKMKQGDKILVVSAASGLFTAVLPLLAVGATLAIPGAIVGLALYFAVKVAVNTVQSGYKGLKWSAEKTVDGAKYTAEKVRDGAVHVRDSVKEAVSSVGQATREGTSSALRAMGDGVQKFGRKMSNSGVSMSSLDGIPYSIGNEGQTVVLKTEEKTRNFNSVKEMFIKEVLEDKAVNSSALTKEIFSKLGEKILEKACSVDGQQSAKKDQLINQLRQQADFVNKLDAKKLQNLLSKDNNSLYEIFSDHHDEIKKIIGECKEEHKLSNSIENLNKVARKCGTRKGSMQSIENSLSRSNSLNSIGTESTAIVSDSDSQNFATVRRSNSSNSLNASPKLIPVAPPELPRSASLTNLNGQSSFSEDVLSDSTVKQNLNSLSNRTLTRSNSFDSAVGSSGSSTSKRQPVVERLKNSWKQKEEQNPPISTPEVPRSLSIDSAIGSSGSSTPEGQGPSVKELLEQFDPLYKPSSLKDDVSVTDGIELKR
ncbi:actin-bundling T4SS effector WalE1 family protein [Wolbachia endosymbiont (group A) of Anomoia purmunda]|uniref:actin-bundling T4SS effector WalE1 family protein n=1 Tax=Wolbachia endosymbiont (group A) of Anomoia purmunda TaxID=2953978 RepID=UPI002A0A3625|nr:hypothetical protein [Wolbachia endosymbiont (group A) of Anomoia purmunda]